MSCERCGKYEGCKREGRVVVKKTEDGEVGLLGLASVCPLGSYMDGALNTLAEINEILSDFYGIRIDPSTGTVSVTCKDENSPSDERKEDDDMEVPSAEKGAESDDLREEISTLWDAIDLLEKRIERLEDKVYG